MCVCHTNKIEHSQTSSFGNQNALMKLRSSAINSYENEFKFLLHTRHCGQQVLAYHGVFAFFLIIDTKLQPFIIKLDYMLAICTWLCLPTLCL